MDIVYACIVPHGSEAIAKLAGDGLEALSETRKGMQKVDFGSWQPKREIYLCLLIALTSIVITLTLQSTYLKILFGIIAILSCFLAIAGAYLYYRFNKKGKLVQNQIWDFVIEKLNWDGKGRGLDIGTGAGALAIRLARRCPTAKLTGIDYWGKSWDYSKEQCENNARISGVGDRVIFMKGSASKIPFEDNTFDAIVSNDVFHEVRDTKDKTLLFREAIRVLKTGGVFAIHDVMRYVKDKAELLETIKSWNVRSVKHLNTNDRLGLPRFLGRFMRMELIYGEK
jgi:ubiquinone/menaquinone biosynthesis C-methylase UbiE